jgi:DNA-binding NtrC family response regulator
MIIPNSQNAKLNNPILLVDDDEDLLRSVQRGLKFKNITNVDTCSQPLRVMELLERKPYDLVFLDLWMPELNGEELLQQIRATYEDLPVIIISANQDVDTAVTCIRNGARNYLVKPVEPAQMVAHIRQILEVKNLKEENRKLRSFIPDIQLLHPEDFAEIITVSDSMKLLFQYIEAAAPGKNTVLISGESGTGKELFARAIHKSSKAPGEFVAVNMGGMDDTAVYSALFGHLKGSYTGADKERKGYIQRAAGGTLFLDEIGDLSLESQVKLLRLLQEREYYPLGSDTPRKVECRFVVATHRDIGDTSRFRADLYYRLRTHHIKLPPLRDRKQDLEVLVKSFIEEHCREQELKEPYIPGELYPLLSNYSFPGNIRELKNIIIDALVQTKGGHLSLQPVRDYIFQDRDKHSQQTGSRKLDLSRVEPLPTLKSIQDSLVREAMRRSKKNQSTAAGMLGITRQALNRRLQQMDTDKPENK